MRCGGPPLELKPIGLTSIDVKRTSQIATVVVVCGGKAAGRLQTQDGPYGQYAEEERRPSQRYLQALRSGISAGSSGRLTTPRLRFEHWARRSKRRSADGASSSAFSREPPFPELARSTLLRTHSSPPRSPRLSYCGGAGGRRDLSQSPSPQRRPSAERRRSPQPTVSGRERCGTPGRSACRDR